MEIRRCCAGLLVCACAASAAAQSLSDSPIVLQSGAWAVHRIQDPMTDASVCLATYGHQDGVQLGAGMFSITTIEPVKKVQLRFDDDSAQSARAATHSEFKNNRIEITGSDFSTLLDSRRLRYEATTISNATLSGDIDLNGAYVAHGNVAAGCAGNPINTPKPAASDNCTQELRQRMTDQGIPPANIDKICRG